MKIKFMMSMEETIHGSVMEYAEKVGLNRTSAISVLCGLGLQVANAQSMINQMERIVEKAKEVKD